MEKWVLGYERMIQNSFNIEGVINCDLNYFDGSYFYLGGDGVIGKEVFIFKYDKNCNLVWKRNIKTLAQNVGLTSQSGQVTSINVINDRLYIACDTGYIMGNKSEFYCLDKEDGSFIYKTDLSQNDTLSITARATPWNDYILLPISDGEKVGDDRLLLFYIFRKDCVNGTPIAIRRYGALVNTIGELPIHENELFLLTNQKIIVFNLSKLVDPSFHDDECVLREIKEPNRIFSVYGHNMFLNNNSYINVDLVRDSEKQGNWLVARSLIDDSIQWETKFSGGYWDEYGMLLATTMVPFGDSLILPSAYGRVACVNMNDGHIIWENDAFPSDELSSNIDAHGVVIADKWYVQPSYSLGMVYVFDVRTGETLLAFKMSHYFTSVNENCWEADGLFYFLALDGFSAIRFYEK